jgi:hypothetical protein
MIGEKLRCATGNGRKRNPGSRIDAALQSSQKGIVGTPVQLPKEARPCRVTAGFGRKFLETMEEYVNDDDIGVQAIDSGRKNEVEPKPANPAIPRPANGIEEQPDEALEKMRTGNRRNFMPDDCPEVVRTGNTCSSQCKPLNVLGIKMNLTMLFARQALEQLGKRALRAMATVNER